MKKFTFIGAGSLDFTKDLVRDILTFEAFRDAELMLMDIDPKRLEYAVKGVQKIVDAGKYPAVVKGTQDRKEALKDADGVLITILQGGVEVWRHDIEIPKKYNVDICVCGSADGPACARARGADRGCRCRTWPARPLPGRAGSRTSRPCRTSPRCAPDGCGRRPRGSPS